ncbi:neugrin isoform X2 [Hyperolius riggenbachi]
MKKQQKAIRFQRMKREMEPPGPPERRLTWNAIEQIRHLREEFPEEWTVQRLAVGFNVGTDEIRRVLKSKFLPSAARKMKQDASVSRRLGQISSGAGLGQLQLTSSATGPAQQLLSDGRDKGNLLVSQPVQPLPAPRMADVSPVAMGTWPYQASSLVPQHSIQAGDPAASSAISPNRQEEPAPSVPTEEEELEETWDGEVLSDNELEELATSGLENKMKVVQKGCEFYDEKGDFLYSI